MLIPSERHTAEDLRCWAELEESDAQHWQLGKVQAKASQSAEILRQFIAAGTCYVSVSWGKDSVVTADLALRVSPSIPIYWVRWRRHENPDSINVRDWFLAQRPHACYHEVIAPDDDDDDGREGFAMLREAAGDRRVTGIRQDESRSRRLSAVTHGHITASTCRPILRWTIEDVYAYAWGTQLPLHPAYAMNGGGRWSRQMLRVDSLGGRRGDGIGRSQWEQEYYRDHLRRLSVR